MKTMKLIAMTALLLPALALAAPAKKTAKEAEEKAAATAPVKEANPAIALKADPAASKVTFLAVGKPSMLKIHGTASSGPAADLKLEGNQLKGAAEFEMEKLDTGINLRNQHMKEKYLHVKEHPKSKLTLVDAAVDGDFASTLSNGGEKPFKGTLLLHGKEKEVSGTYTAKNGQVQAKFPIKLSEFAIDIPSYLGVTVADTVDVNVDLSLKK
jgi:hypothetical protein